MNTVSQYKHEFSDVLLNNFVKFWETYSPGFDRDGSLFHEDKSVWQQGRSLWMFSKLYNEFGGKKEWLEIARSGYDFINNYCFDETGHMYFKVTRDGKPLVVRRYYFSEAFAKDFPGIADDDKGLVRVCRHNGCLDGGYLGGISVTDAQRRAAADMLSERSIYS